MSVVFIELESLQPLRLQSNREFQELREIFLMVKGSIYNKGSQLMVECHDNHVLGLWSLQTH